MSDVLKILVAEDEAILREAIATVITREFEADVRTVSDGHEALDIYREFQPDIVITDIRMPRMDGLELAERIAASGGEPHILILTAYSEFNYAKKAIECGVFQYLVKSLDYNELKRHISRAMELVEKKREDKRRQTALSLHMARYETERVHKKLLDLLRGVHVQETSGLELSRTVVICGFSLQSTNRTSFHIPNDSRLVAFAAENIVMDVTGSLDIPTTFLMENDHRFVLLLWVRPSPSEHRNHESLQRIAHSVQAAKQALKQFFRFQVYCEVGSIIPLREAKFAYPGMVKRLNAQQAAEEPVLELSPGAAVAMTQELMLEVMSAERVLMESIRHQWADTAEKAAEHLFFDSCKNIDEARMSAFQILYYLCGVFEAENIPHAAAYIRSIGIPTQLSTKPSVKQLFDWFTQTIHQLTMLFHEKSLLSRHPIIASIEREIASDPRYEFSLKEFADEIGMNATYLSELFHKETGITLTDYLVEVKMKAAKRKLLEPTRKIYEVAEELGYADGRYFSQVFRKYTGVTPKQFQLSGGLPTDTDNNKQFPK